MTSVKFGLNDEFNFNTNSATINAFYPIKYHEYLATTRNGLFKFEDDVIKKIYPLKLATSILIPEYRFIVGVSSLGGEIMVMLIDELENPIFSHFKTDQLNIFHIIYSSRSHALITVGSGIKVWNFNVKMPRKITLIHKPEITITLRAEIAPEYNTPILNPPTIDYDQELLYLPTPNGFCGYDLNGKQKKLFSKIDSTPQTAASLCLENKKFITSSQGDGFHLWSQKGYLIKKIPGVMSSILALRFINKHFALFVDSNFWIFIIDIKTSNFFHCFTISSKPNYFNVYRDSNNGKYYLLFSQGSLAKKMEIILPWTVWKKMTTQPCSIRRCPKYKEAARILTYYKSSIYSFLSPKDGKNLTSAVDTQPSGPIFHYYDRGLFLEPIFDETNSFVTHTNIIEIFPESKRDVLFVTTAESNTSLFSTGNNPCDLTKIIEIQVSSITVCEIDGTFMYCFSNSQGELLFYNYSDFSRYSRKLILKKPIKRVFYHRKSASIIVVFQDEIHRFDLKTFKDVQRIPMKNGGYSEFYGNLLLIGCKNGNIESFRIDNLNGSTYYRIIQMTDDCIHYHDDEITSFSFSPTFFISSSLDKTVKIWNYNFNLLFDIIFPFPLFSCEILNAKRDILVGTDNEILKINGSSLFGDDSIDKEVEEIDNYDKISDELTNQLIQFAVEKNKDDQSDFLSSRNKNKEAEESAKKAAKPRKFNVTFTTNNNEELPDNKKNSSKDATELTEEERNRRLYEMNLINERSDNEKLQAKLRAEMKMKKDEEERKRKLKELEEAKLREKMKNEEEEEEEKVEEKGKRRRKRRVRHSKNQNDEVQHKESKKIDDFDDFLFKPKKKKETGSIDENPFQRKKAAYKPKQSAPRPYRPYRANTKQKDQDGSENENEYDYDDEYDNIDNNSNDDIDKTNNNDSNDKEYEVDEYNDDIDNDNGYDDESMQGQPESVLRRHKHKRGDKNDLSKKNRKGKSSNEDSNSTKKKKKVKKGRKRRSQIEEGDLNNEEEDGYIYEYEYEDEDEDETLNEKQKRKRQKGHKNKNGNENDSDASYSYYNDDDGNGKRRRKRRKTENENGNDHINGDKTNSNIGDNNDINENTNSMSTKANMAEIDTQTSYPYDNKDDQESLIDGKKGTGVKKRINQSIPQEGVSGEKDDLPKSHSNKKRSGAIQKSGKSNSTEERKGNKENKNSKESKNNKGNKNASDNDEKDSNNNNNEKKSKQNKNKQKRKHEQIFLTDKLKRAPTPPPDKKVLYTKNPINSNIDISKTLNPNRSFTRFRKRYPLRRCRTPPVLDQEKLVLLPGPEIVFDREAIIDKILDGNVELMPLLKRLISDDRSYYIQRLKQGYYRGANAKPSTQPQPPQPQFHNFQFNFPTNDDDCDTNNSFSNKNSIFKSNKNNKDDSNSYTQQPSLPSKFLPLIPPNRNTNLRKPVSQKVETDEIAIAIFGEENQSQIQEQVNFQSNNSLTFKKEKKQKPQRQHQISILNLGFEPQRPVPPLNFAPKREIMMPNVHKPYKNYNNSPRRNQIHFQKAPSLFVNESEVERGSVAKSTENFIQGKIGPLPQYHRTDAHQKSLHHNLFRGVRSSSPPALYRPKLLDKPKNNNNRVNRNLH